MRKLFSRSVKSFSRDEKGATMIEYAIVVGMIALIAIVGVTAFGSQLSTQFTELGTTLNSVNTSK
jgi:pilus assembly protein Flp/PilA